MQNTEKALAWFFIDLNQGFRQASTGQQPEQATPAAAGRRGLWDHRGPGAMGPKVEAANVTERGGFAAIAALQEPPPVLTNIAGNPRISRREQSTILRIDQTRPTAGNDPQGFQLREE